jgi:putative two-component system response regulator
MTDIFNGDIEILTEEPEFPKNIQDFDVPPAEKAEKNSALFSGPRDFFPDTGFPALLIDRELKIIYASRSCENLSTGFPLAGSNFIEVFGSAFALKDLQEIRSTLLTGINGYFWKGKARMKSRHIVTVQTRVYILPKDPGSKEPGEFLVIFDDVTEENKNLLRSVFISLLEASKLKDNDTGKHITRVNFYSRRLAEELYRKHGRKYNRIDADFIENIGFLASMHDVGKIGTPDDILNKKGPLSDWEWKIMQEHTKNGAFILSTYPNPMAKEIALSHHERWDGSGYPFQLEGEMIPLAARIVAIADVYDALRMRRIYKPALSHGTVLEKMREGRGTHFDPFLSDVFSAINGDFNRIYEENPE